MNKVPMRVDMMTEFNQAKTLQSFYGMLAFVFNLNILIDSKTKYEYIMQIMNS